MGQFVPNAPAMLTSGNLRNSLLVCRMTDRFKIAPKHIVATGALVSNSAGEVLLIDSPWRGWEFPGGQVEEGEDIVSALKREVMEETGVEITVGSMVGMYTNLTHSVLITTFLADYVSGELTTSKESLQVKWVSRQQALADVTHPTVHMRLQDMLDYNGSTVYRAYTIEPYKLVTGHHGGFRQS